MDYTDANYSVVAENLCKTYGSVDAVKDVSFKIKAGEILGFLGPNGAGKSTTMRILSGLMPATSGKAYVCGVSVANNPSASCAHIGYMPENNPLPEDVRVIEYLTYRAGIKGLYGAKLKQRVGEVMEACQLTRKVPRRIIGNLSKGFRQRVGIADALLASPDVVIMDEPTIGLDPHQIIAIRELIDSLRGRMSVVISSHILPEIELVCDSVLIINQGTVVASGTPEELRKEFLPHSNYEFSAKASPDEIRAIIEPLGLGLTLDSVKAEEDSYSRFVLKTTQANNFGDILIRELSSKKGLALRSLNMVKPSLEDIFMAATRRSWEQSRADTEADYLNENSGVSK